MIIKRIITLCPIKTEILFALGLGERVVRVDSHSDYPTEVLNLPKVGPDLRINIGKVKALKPDLVIAPLTVPSMKRNVEALRKMKLPYIVLNPKYVKEILEDILILGKLTDTIQKAEKLVEYMTNTIDSLKSELGKNQFKPKLYWEWWPKPLIATCKLNWIYE